MPHGEREKAKQKAETRIIGEFLKVYDSSFVDTLSSHQVIPRDVTPEVKDCKNRMKELTQLSLSLSRDKIRVDNDKYYCSIISR